MLEWQVKQARPAVPTLLILAWEVWSKVLETENGLAFRAATTAWPVPFEWQPSHDSLIRGVTPRA